MPQKVLASPAPSGAFVSDTRHGLAQQGGRSLNEETGEWHDEPTTRDVCKAFGRLADNIAESLTTGTGVIAVGETQTETWTDKDSGENRYKDVVRVRALGPDLEWATASVTRNPKSAEE